jgi:ribose transport system ATP-binding protein
VATSDPNLSNARSAPPGDDGHPAALRVDGLRKVFGGTVALAEAWLHVGGGEIHGLLGENGAGKSTLIRILAGIHASDGGEVRVDGKLLPPRHSSEVASNFGLAFIHQDVGLVPDLSVAENIALAVGFPTRARLIGWRAVRAQAADALGTLGSSIRPETSVAELSIGDRAVVAIARCLAQRARIVILDEPTASLAAEEVSALFRILRNLAAQGVGIVFVTHRMDEVRTLCERATILRDGRTVAQVELRDISDERLVELIVGHEIHAHERVRQPGTSRKVAVRVQDAVSQRVGPATFEVEEGEIVALTGISGAGHDHIGDCLFGLRPLSAGTISTSEHRSPATSPREAVARRIAYVPADRVSQGVATRLTLQENLELLPRATGGRRSTRWWSTRSRRDWARQTLSEFGVRPPEPNRELSTLSGGNAQKVLLAKWIASEPRLLILNEPATGVDVGARDEIYELISSFAQRGRTVLVASSDFEEVHRLCDRVLVFRKGRVVLNEITASTTVQSVSSAAMHGES